MHVYSLGFDWCALLWKLLVEIFVCGFFFLPFPFPFCPRCVDVINDYISVYNAAYCTGVLDIFGFENFTTNSFPQAQLARFPDLVVDNAHSRKQQPLGVFFLRQLCINFTNESLHNLFIEHVFKLEQEVLSPWVVRHTCCVRSAVALAIWQVYVREEVQWNFVSYEDNQHVIDLIAKRPVCVLGLLDEGCATGSGKVR